MCAAKTKTSSSYERANDVAGLQVHAILQLRPASEAWASKIDSLIISTPDTMIGRVYHDELKLVGPLIKRGPYLLDELAELIAARSPIVFDERAACYFHQIFPRFAAPLFCSAPKAMLSPGNLLFALRRASEFLQVPTLIKDAPSSWKPEHRIFEKERIFGQRIRQDRIFLQAIETLRKNYPDKVGQLRSPLIGDRTPEETQNHFLNDVAAICGDWSLMGLTKDLNPIPSRFEIRMGRSVLEIRVPAYMEFDWRRDLPSAVIKVLHARGHFMSSLRPLRLNEQDRARGWGCTDEDLLTAYNKYAPRLGKDLTKSELYDLLADELHITSASGPDDRRRVVRRRLKNILPKS